MKKIVFALSILLFAATSFAQECMSFKGISFNNNLQTFSQKMKENGMTLTSTDNSESGVILIFKGNFANNSDCDIYVSAPKDKSCVCKVSVYTKEFYSWYSLKSKYENLKNSFENKYGIVDNDYHFFEYPYEDGDGYEMSAVKMDKCYYAAFWHLSYGSICVNINKFSSVRITYEDTKNMNKLKAQAEQSINQDI